MALPLPGRLQTPSEGAVPSHQENVYYTVASPRQAPPTSVRVRRLAVIGLALACYIAALTLSVQVFLAGGHWWGVDVQPLKSHPGEWQVTWSDIGLSKDYNLLVGDIILRADGRVPQNADEINHATTLEVLSSGQNTPYTVTWSVPVPGVLLVGWSLFGLISLLLGVLVFLHATDRPLALRFFALWTAMSIAATLTAAVSYGNLLATHTSSYLYIGVVVGLLANTLWFFLVRASPTQARRLDGSGSPSPVGRQRWVARHRLPELLIAGGLCLETPTMFFLLEKQVDLYKLLGIFPGLWTIFALCFSLVLLLRASFSRRISAARERARTLLGGMLVGILPVLLLSIIPQVFTGKLLVNATISALTLIAIPLAFAYAVVRRDFLGMDSLARQTALVLLTVIGIAMSSVMLAEVTAPLLPTSTVLIIVALAAVLVLLIVAGARWLTDAWLFPEVRRYRRMIVAGEKARETGLDPRRLVGQIIGEVRLLLPVREVAVFAPDRRTARLVALLSPETEEGSGEPSTPPNILARSLSASTPQTKVLLPIDQAIYNHLSHNSRPIPVELRQAVQHPSRNAPLQPGQGSNKMSSADGAPSGDGGILIPTFWHLLVPFTVEQHLVGVLAVGEREDGQGYSETDLRLLRERARYHALALDYLLRYAELQTAYRQRYEIDRLKDQFIVTMQRDIQVPLGRAKQVLAGLADLSSEELVQHATEVPLWIKRVGAHIEDVSQRLQRFVADAEMELRPRQLVIQMVMPYILAQQVIQNLEAPARQKHLLIRNNLPKDLCLLADSKAFTQVLEILLSNAIRSSQEGRLVELIGGASTFGRQPVAELVVHEWGAGVPPSQQYQIFERFTQSDVGGHEKLPQCKELVEAMGGEIWVESTGVIGARTAFHLTLPLAAVEARPSSGFVWRQG